MDVGLSIEEGGAGMNNSNKVVKKDKGGAFREMIRKSKKREEIWRSRRTIVENALAAARTAARHDQAEVDALFRSFVRVIMGADVNEFLSEIEKLPDQTDPSAIFNFREPSGRSLLHIAAGANKDEILRLLLGCVPYHLMASQDDWGDTPLHVAVKVRGYKAAVNLIHRAAELHVEVKKQVLRRRNKQGNTALHEAVLNNDFRLVFDLLKEDLEPVHWKNADHKSPLYLALDTSSSLKQQIFFSLPFNPSMIQGLSPVHGAILRSDYGLVEQILEENMELFAMTDSRKGNVFHLAAYMNKPQVFERARGFMKLLI